MKLSPCLALLLACTNLLAAEPLGTVPPTMQAVRFHEFGGPEQLRLESVPTPRPGRGEVLVEVHAASVNPIDWKLREGWGRGWWPVTLPSIPGRDGAGVVRAVGEGVTNVAPGDAVAAYLGTSSQGTYAEYVVAAAADVVLKPAPLSFEEAAAYPLVAMTALQALEKGRLAAGERVLVHGGAGGVGSFAVQIARQRGAHVIATASAPNHEFVRSLGADEVVDYRAAPFEKSVRDVDLVIDTVGGDTLARSVGVVKRGGRIVTIAADPPEEQCAQAGIDCSYILVSSDARTLGEVTRLIDEGRLRVFVETVYPLEQAAAAQEKNRAGRTRGKIVLKLR